MQNKISSEKRVAVIGSGPAGLAAAWRASRAGADVVLYEASRVTGGLLRTETLPGTEVGVDAAVQLVSSTYTRLFALATETGTRDMLVRASGRDALWRKGGAQEITYGNVASMATSGALPTMLKLRLATKYVPFLTLHAGSLDANDPAHTGGAAYDGESIATWGRREMSDDFTEYLAYPLLAAYYGSLPEKTTAAMYHALARVGMEVQVYAARGGMGALAQRMTAALQAQGVTVRTGANVEAISRDTMWRVHVDADEQFDAVIVATPPHIAHSLVQPIDSAVRLAEWLSGAGSHAATTIGIAVNGVLRSPYFGVSFPRLDAPGDRIVAVTAQQNKPAAIVPPTMSALTVFPAPDVAARVATMTSEEALAFIKPSLERAYPGVTARTTAVQVYADMRYRDIEPGFIRRIQQLDDLELPRGLAIAGDYTIAPTVEGAVRSGERAAARALM